MRRGQTQGRQSGVKSDLKAIRRRMREIEDRADFLGNLLSDDTDPNTEEQAELEELRKEYRELQLKVRGGGSRCQPK